MTAKLIPDYKTKFTTSHRKEKNGFTEEYAVIMPDSRPGRENECYAPITARIYWGSSRCYCCLWAGIRSKDNPHYQVDSRNGSGFAGGGGYHKASAALQEAITNAGFALDQAIDGRGEGYMQEALLAIAAACGYPEGRIHRAHA